MKRTVATLLAITATIAAHASTLDATTTRRAAFNFWNSFRPENTKAIQESQLQHFEVADLPHLHIYTVGNDGFLVMSADDCVMPVLAYSFNSPLCKDTLNSSMHYWLRGYEQQIAALSEAKTQPSAKTVARWNNLLQATPPAEPLTITSVPELLTCRWDQGTPYNRLCPFDSTFNSRTVVGCTATAMAQIMYYWKYPVFGTGEHEYTHYNTQYGESISYGTLQADFSQTTYHWDFMADELFLSNNQRAIQAVAKLSYHCGISVDMQYNVSEFGGSGAFVIDGGYNHPCSEHAFRDYFKYSPDLHGESRGMYDDSTWKSMINEDINNNRPILYTGYDESAGHAFVLDGSDIDEHYHFNWGWAGYGNGFYTIDNLNPGGSGIGGNSTYTFNFWQEAIFNLYPAGESFDTVDIEITTCDLTSKYHFYDYDLPMENDTLFANHLDTVFHLTLNVEPKDIAYFTPNGGEGSRFSRYFCSVDGITMPECNFTHPTLRFLGWGENTNGEGNIYQPGQKVDANHSTIFYAIWRDSATVVALGVDNPQGESTQIDIFPNPTTAKLDISADQPILSATIFDHSGRALRQEDNSNGCKMKINIENLPKGPYVIQVRTSDAIYNKRIIKQ